MAVYTADNIEITIANSNSAVIATDYGTSGAVGFSAAHAQISKLAWGDENYTYRVNESYPAPVKIYGSTGSAISISGTVSGTGSFYVRTNSGVPLVVIGSTFTTDAPIGICGSIQGITNGRPVGVTGYVNILNNVGMYGISGATAIGVTGGRRLNSTTDSVTVYGSVGISGGFQLSAYDDSIAVYGPGGTTYVETNLNVGGVALGLSGDALKVAVTNTGFTFSVSVSATTGVTNSDGPLRVQGYTGNGTPVTIQGILAGGAVEVAAYSSIPVGVSGSVTIDDTDIISEIDSLRTDIGTVATNAGYALDILNLINTSGSGARVIVNSIVKPNRVFHGQKTLTTTPVQLGTEAVKSGVTIKSSATNTVDIYIGNSLGVSTTTGYILSPGETIYLEVSSLSTTFVRSASGSATLSFIGT
jgi:hypothetical protein